MTALAINRETISATYNRLRGHVRKTPVLQVNPADFDCTASELHLKLEYLQNTGSFKARGAATHFLAGTPPDAGVVAASGGNHGIAVAYAAKQFHSLAAIFVPEKTPTAKTDAIARHGAALFREGANYAEAFEAAEAYQRKTGAKLVHAYDQPETLVGQGTVGLELEAQAPGLTTLLVAVGGGGLIGGIAGWYQGRLKLVAVEPEGCPTLKTAMDAGSPTDIDVGGVAVDSLGARRIGTLSFPLCQTFVEDTVIVSDDAICEAQARLWSEARIVAEPGGATAMAALTSGVYKPGPEERIGVLVCGANTDRLPLG
jgi:threonine dehydratase